MTRRTSLATAACLVLVLSGLQNPAAATSPGPSAATPLAAAGVGHRSTEIAPGVVYRRIYNKKIPRVTHVLTIDPSIATLGVATAKPTLPGFATTSAMARAQDAVAAVNGDFGLAPGRPAHLLARDGELYQTTAIGAHGHGFGIPSTGGTFRIGTTRPRISLTDGSLVAPISAWNSGPPARDALAGFSSWGGTLEESPSDSCAARLLPIDPDWSAHASGMVRAFTVDAVRCGTTPMTLGGGVVIAAKQAGVGADEIDALVPGDAVDLRWTLGWTGVRDVLGGGFQLLTNGAVTVDKDCASSICARNPRTGVGITADGHILVVVVEGRYWRSKGITPIQFAHTFTQLGAVDALNLDGGGSSTMVLGGRVVNYTSDGYERAVSSALVILPTA